MALELFLAETLAVLVAAVAVLLICARLRLPAVAGLPLTGVLIGPSGLALVHAERVEVFAEVGVVLLLFTIGLELSVGQLVELKRPFLAGGSLQALLTAGAATLALVAAGLPGRTAVFAALIVTLSSTAVVLKLYADRGESETPPGRVILGILLFQDFLVVPMLVLAPVLAGAVAGSGLALAGLFAASLAALGVVFVTARFAVPRLLDRFVRSRVREVFVLGALALCLAMAWTTQSLGLSAALGAFLAGVLVSESEYSHQVVADIAPFRDVFASVFFVSIGMLVDVPRALAHLPAIVGAALAVVALKAAAATAAVRWIGYPARVAWVAGLGLAQIGEFSFVVMTLGRGLGLLSEDAFQLLLGTAVLTLLATPALVHVAPALADRLGRGAPRSAAAPIGLARHVVIVGYGVNGGLLARVLDEAHIPHVVVELAADTARRARREGREVIWGDATRREILERAGVPRAEVVVFAVSDSQAVQRSVRLARQLNPTIEIVVRTRRVHEIEALQEAGADQIVAEEFETAIEVFTRVLGRYHVPRHLVRAQTRALRGEGYRMLRAEALHPEVSQAVLDALAAGTTDLFQVERDGPAAGRTLRELELRQRSGATVIALVRGERSHTNPSPEMAIEPGDCLVLVGSHEEIDRAFAMLEGGETG